MKTTVIFHSADYDGIFCREIARKFLPEAELIGWDFPDKPLAIPEGQIYILDLPLDKVFGFDYSKSTEWPTIPYDRIVWIDHHRSSIASHPPSIPGYRIDGVAACRLAWQWFSSLGHVVKSGYHSPLTTLCDDWRAGGLLLPVKKAYAERTVEEPLAVRLAGEYDIWDHRGDGDLEFQFGLDAQPSLGTCTFDDLLRVDERGERDAGIIVADGRAAMRCYAKRDADVMRARSFVREWEGLKFLSLNTARCNSQTFSARDVPETGHDALLAFGFNGKLWTVSLYHAAHRKDLDLSLIAVKHGGGGHAGAAGFTAATLPFLP